MNLWFSFCMGIFYLFTKNRKKIGYIFTKISVNFWFEDQKYNEDKVCPNKKTIGQH